MTEFLEVSWTDIWLRFLSSLAKLYGALEHSFVLMLLLLWELATCRLAATGISFCVLHLAAFGGSCFERPFALMWHGIEAQVFPGQAHHMSTFRFQGLCQPCSDDFG